MNGKKWLVTAAAVSWACVAGGAFANDPNSTDSQQPVKDSVITTKVKAELAKDNSTKAREIHVATKNGVVNLTGMVDTSTEKQKAEQDARAVKGVIDVQNELTVNR